MKKKKGGRGINYIFFFSFLDFHKDDMLFFVQKLELVLIIVDLHIFLV